MSAYRDTAQHAAEAVSVGVAQGRSFIARCEDLDRQMLKVDALAGQVCVLAPPMGLVRGGSAVPSTAHIRWSSSEPLVRVRVGLTALIRTCPSPVSAGVRRRCARSRTA